MRECRRAREKMEWIAIGGRTTVGLVEGRAGMQRAVLNQRSRADQGGHEKERMGEQNGSTEGTSQVESVGLGAGKEQGEQKGEQSSSHRKEPRDKAGRVQGACQGKLIESRKGGWREQGPHKGAAWREQGAEQPVNKGAQVGNRGAGGSRE